MPTKGTFLPRQRIIELLRDYEDTSITLSELESKYEIGTSRIYAELQAAGKPRRVEGNAQRHVIEESRAQAIVDAYSTGAPVLQIAKEYSINYDQVYVVLRERGLKLRTSDRRRLFDPEFQQRLRSLYSNESLSLSDIALELATSMKTLTRMVAKLDLAGRGRGGGRRGTPKRVTERIPEFAHRAANGERVRALAAEAGIGESTLRQKIRAFWDSGPDSRDA